MLTYQKLLKQRTKWLIKNSYWHATLYCISFWPIHTNFLGWQQMNLDKCENYDIYFTMWFKYYKNVDLPILFRYHDCIPMSHKTILNYLMKVLAFGYGCIYVSYWFTSFLFNIFPDQAKNGLYPIKCWNY